MPPGGVYLPTLVFLYEIINYTMGEKGCVFVHIDFLIAPHKTHKWHYLKNSLVQKLQHGTQKHPDHSPGTIQKTSCAPSMVALLESNTAPLIKHLKNIYMLPWLV